MAGLCFCNCRLLIPVLEMISVSIVSLADLVGSDQQPPSQSVSLPSSVSLQRCFTLMDRGFTFKLISNYINMITATDSKVSPEHAGNPADSSVQSHHGNAIKV